MLPCIFGRTFSYISKEMVRSKRRYTLTSGHTAIVYRLVCFHFPNAVVNKHITKPVRVIAGRPEPTSLKLAVIGDCVSVKVGNSRVTQICSFSQKKTVSPIKYKIESSGDRAS